MNLLVLTLALATSPAADAPKPVIAPTIAGPVLVAAGGVRLPPKGQVHVAAGGVRLPPKAQVHVAAGGVRLPPKAQVHVAAGGVRLPPKGQVRGRCRLA